MVRAGITGGCGGGNYCPANPVNRAQMAVFLLVANEVHEGAINHPGTAWAWRYAYDVQDHLVKVTDAANGVTTYTYSDRDLMTRQVSEVSGTTESRYDEHGGLATETDAPRDYHDADGRPARPRDRYVDGDRRGDGAPESTTHSAT